MLPIPPDFPDVNDAQKTLQTVIYQNHHDLRSIAEDAMGQIGDVIDANDRDKKSISKQITTKLAATIGANAKDCAHIADLVSQMQSGFQPPILPGIGPPIITPPKTISPPSECSLPDINDVPPQLACEGNPCLLAFIRESDCSWCPGLYDTLPLNPLLEQGYVVADISVLPIGANWLGQYMASKGWTNRCIPPLPPAPPEPICPPGEYYDPSVDDCVPIPPIPPTPLPTPICPPGTEPDPITGECIELPPTPPTPPTPVQGSDCNTPIYVKLCIDAPPIQQCTPDAGPLPPESVLGGNGELSSNEVGFPTGNAPTTTAGCAPTVIPLPQSSPAAIFAECLVDGQIPPVGSAAWCSCINSLHHWFADFGSAAVAIFGCVDPVNPIVQQQQVTPLIQQFIGPLTQLPIVGSVIQGLANGIQGIVQSLCNTVGQAGFAQVVSGGSELIGLTVARTIIRLLRNLRVGTDAVLWMTVDIEVELKPIEKVLDYLTNYVMSTEIPSIGDALECYLNNTAPPELVKCWLLLRGADPGVWNSVLYAKRQKLSTDEVIENARRSELNPQQQIDALRNYGWIDSDEAEARVRLYDELPSAQDFLHYLQRNVYDTQYVQDYGLLDGFDERYWANFGAQLSAIGITYERSKLDYASHWIRPAPGELREFVYRNNPDYYAGPNPTTVEDYRRTLAEQDYSPWDVKRYVDTIYRVPALGYLRDMYRSYLLSDEQMKVYHQKLGYSGEDSDHFVEIDKLVRARIRASESHGWTPAALASAFSVGILTDSDVVSHMQEMGYSSDESQTLMSRATAELQRTIIVRARSRVQFAVLTQVKQALTSGIIDASGAINAITQLGWPLQFAQGWVQIQASALQVKLVNQTVARIRSAFLSGEIDAAFAASSLTRLGVVQAYIEQTLVAWELQLTPQRKRRSAAQIVSDLSYGMLDTSEALVRLTNLGYYEPDRMLYLADAQRKLVQREAKEAAAQQKTARQQAADLRRLEADARSQANRLHGVLQRVASRPTLMTWAKHGIISFDEFSQSMKDLQYDDDNIQRYWLDACSAKTAKCDTTQAPTENPPANADGSVYTPDELGGIMP